MKKRFAIIGAGVSGLSTGQLLNESGFEVVIFEQHCIPGGLISCSKVNNILFHKVGGHVFNSRNKEVLDWYWSKFDRNDFCQIKRIAKIYMNDCILGYPIENYIRQLDKQTISAIVNELLEICRNPTSATENNFEFFLKSHFGDTLYRIYFKPYNEKIWKTDLSEIPLEWLDGKLPMPNIAEILLSNIVGEEESTMVHSRFWYPKKDGSQFIADNLAKGLDIRYDTPIQNMTFDENRWNICNEWFDEVIYTGDVRQLADILTDEILPKELKQQLGLLKSNGTSNVLCEIDDNEYSWMYFPESKYKIHRIIYTGNFAKSNNGNSPRKTCTIEYSGLLSEELLRKEVERLPGSPKVISYNYEPNSYIYHTHGTSTIITEVRKQLDTFGMHLVGRFAEWEYYNMDKAIESGMRLVNRLSN